MSEQPSLFRARADIEIEKELWEAAVKLRGNIAPADYKHFVLPLLFLRYLSLRYERRHEELRRLVRDPQSEYHTDDPEIEKEILEDEDEYRSKGVYLIPEEARWSYLVAHAQDDDIKLKLDRAMEVLEQAYPDLRGVLPKIYAGSNLDRDNVADLINLFARDIFTGEADKDADTLGRVYEYFITNFADTEGKRGGEFFTPGHIVKLLVEMLEPTRGIVFDPACGSGGMFVQSARFTKQRSSLSFYGQERVDNTVRLCKMNLIMHGLNGNIKLGNSLLNDQHPQLRADYVIANPPFNIRAWGADKLSPNDPRLQVDGQRLVPTNGNANYFWMLHFLAHLKVGGTAGYVMANGSMTTNTNEEKATRKALVDASLVDCIVQLPDKLFLGTGIPVCLWLLSKNRTGMNGYRARTDEILFIDARQKGEMVSRRQRVLTDDEIHEIAALYHHFKAAGDNPEDVPGFCKVASLEAVKQHDYKLTPGIYVGTQAEDEDDEPFEEKMPRLIEELQAQFAEAEQLQTNILANLERLV